MDSAKNAVSSFMSKAGHKDTTVHESVAPAVQNETVKEHQREERQVVKDREVHQDHHHTTVQPVHDKEVLPETHHHNLIGTEHRTHDHRNDTDTKQRLESEAAKFTNTSTRQSAQSAHTTTAPEVGGEHVHHHVHERIQPVIHKETIEPHVVHTTVPVHETIHNKAQHHTTSALPAVSIDEFKHSGGSLTGRDTKTDHFTGEPHTVDNVGHRRHEPGAGEHSGAIGHGDTHVGHGHNAGSGHTGTTGTGAGLGQTSSTGTGAGYGQTSTTGTGAGLGQTSSTHTGTGHHGTTEKPKASLLDKLNPMKDSDGDGKKGFMK